MLTIEWSTTMLTKEADFRMALSRAYRTCLYPPSRSFTLQLPWPQLTSWPVAHRRMLLRVLLGLQAQGLDNPTDSRGIPLWGLSSEQVPLPLPYRQTTPLAPPGKGGDPSLSTTLPLPGLGTYAPGSVLLVGDRPGVGWSGRLNWPFISGHRGGCSAWLCDQLEAGGIPETQLHWINAFDQLGAPTIFDERMLKRLAPRIVVALGRHAARWCERLSVRVHEVHHPMHWKRFHNGQRYHLITILKKGTQ